MRFLCFKKASDRTGGNTKGWVSTVQDLTAVYEVDTAAVAYPEHKRHSTDPLMPTVCIRLSFGNDPTFRNNQLRMPLVHNTNQLM